MHLPALTNATKAAIIVAVNTVLLLLQAFNVPVTDAQSALIGLSINSLLGVYVALTFKDSPKRLPDDVEIGKNVDGSSYPIVKVRGG